MIANSNCIITSYQFNKESPLLQICTLIYSLEMLVFTKLTYKSLKSGPPCRQLKRKHQSCHSNAISFAPSPKGLKHGSKWASEIGVSLI